MLRGTDKTCQLQKIRETGTNVLASILSSLVALSVDQDDDQISYLRAESPAISLDREEKIGELPIRLLMDTPLVCCVGYGKYVGK